MFYAELVSTDGKNKKLYYFTEKPSYHEALYAVAPMIPYLYDQHGETWRLRVLSEKELYRAERGVELPDCPASYSGRFYEANYDYEYMVIEKSRLLGLPLGSGDNMYGAYVRNRNTGATTYASPQSDLITHGQIEKALSKCPYDPTIGFMWHPILFPYTKKGNQQLVNLTYYIMTDPILSFPAMFVNNDCYSRQLKWIAEQEGMGW